MTKDRRSPPKRSQPAGERPRKSRRRGGTQPATGPERTPSDGRERLQKVLAAAGLGSRRACEELITAGRIEVNGRTVEQLGERVNPATDKIQIDGEALPKPRLVYFAVHKPRGVLSTNRDPGGRPRVVDLVPPEARVFSVGRLDMESEGLMLLTNDGELAQRLTHPRYEIPKTYQVQVAGQPDEAVLQQLQEGVYLAEGFARVESVRMRGRRRQSSLLEVVLREGKNREIRRVFARCGHKVQHLKRTAIGPLRLGEMPAGAYRPLERREIAALKAAASGEAPQRRPVKRSRPKPMKSAEAEAPARDTPGKRAVEPRGAYPRDAGGRPGRKKAARKPFPDGRGPGKKKVAKKFSGKAFAGKAARPARKKSRRK